MPLRKSFTMKDISAHVDRRYGRYASPDTLKRMSAKLFGPGRTGKEKVLTPRQSGALVKQLIANSKKLTLSESKKEQIRQLLMLRSKEGKYEKHYLSDIAKQASHPKSPISKGLVKQLNKPFFEQMKKEGRLTKTTFNPGKKQILTNLRTFLAGNLNATLEETATHLGISSRTNAQKVFASLGSNFAKELSKARKNAVLQLDKETGQSLAISEIAKRLGLDESYIRDNIRRGKKIGARNRDEKRSKKFLFLLGHFTTPEKGVLSAERIGAITQVPTKFAMGLLEDLKKKGLVYEVDQKASGIYCISPKGLRVLNGLGADSRKRSQTLSQMSLDELEDRLLLLNNATRNGLSVDQGELKLFRQIIERKRTEEYAKKQREIRNPLIQ